MPIVRVPDGRQVRFPDDMPREQIKAYIMEKFPEAKQQDPLTESERADIDRQAAELNRKAGVDNSTWGITKEALKGLASGSLSGAERLANGASFGAYDWVGDKLARAIGQEQLSPKVRRDELAKDSNAISALNVGLDLIGGIPSGGALYKGLASGLRAVPKVGQALGYLTPTLGGAAAGGLYSGFENDSLDSASKGALVGALMGGAVDLAGRGLSKAWSAAEKVKGLPKGFENAAGSKIGAKTLNRAVKESDRIAEKVYQKTPEALENLNRQAMDKLDDAVRGVDVKGQMAGAKKAYGDYIDTNKAKQIVDSDLGIKGLTENQQNWLNQAWTAGKKNTLEKAGSLGHLDEMSKELNKMVQSSRVANPAGVGTVATPETVALQGLKDKVDDVIEKAGLQQIKAQYATAKRLEDSYNAGLKFNPNSIKTRNLSFNTPEDKNAFAQGLVEQIKMNPETKNIAGKARNMRGALREVLGDKADDVFKEIDKIDRSYKNVEKISANATRKLTVPDPVNGNFGLIRELIETGGSMIGGTVDAARRFATAKSAERAADYLLNPNLAARVPLREILAPYLSTGAGLLSGEALRKGE